MCMVMWTGGVREIKKANEYKEIRVQRKEKWRKQIEIRKEGREKRENREDIFILHAVAKA
jgi:hypothetical protein